VHELFQTIYPAHKKIVFTKKIMMNHSSLFSTVREKKKKKKTLGFSVFWQQKMTKVTRPG
jgi:hypothetical protein